MGVGSWRDGPGSSLGGAPTEKKGGPWVEALLLPGAGGGGGRVDPRGWLRARPLIREQDPIARAAGASGTFLALSARRQVRAQPGSPPPAPPPAAPARAPPPGPVLGGSGGQDRSASERAPPPDPAGAGLWAHRAGPSSGRRGCGLRGGGQRRPPGTARRVSTAMAGLGRGRSRGGREVGGWCTPSRRRREPSEWGGGGGWAFDCLLGGAWS